MTKKELEQLKETLRGVVVKEEPIATGRQRGKVKIYFADGTMAIFKPASGEGGGPLGTHVVTVCDGTQQGLFTPASGEGGGPIDGATHAE